MLFRENTEAELEVKKGILDHLEKRIKSVSPLLSELQMERDDIKRDLERLEKELLEG